MARSRNLAQWHTVAGLEEIFTKQTASSSFSVRGVIQRGSQQFESTAEKDTWNLLQLSFVSFPLTLTFLGVEGAGIRTPLEFI